MYAADMAVYARQMSADNSKEISRLKRNLIRALQEGKLFGAALDVFEKEPLPLDHPFVTMENIVLTPHMGAATEDSVLRCTHTCCEEIVQVFKGEPVAFPGNKL